MTESQTEAPEMVTEPAEVIDITESAVEPAHQLVDASDEVLRQALEAILIISDQPVTGVELASSLGVPAERIERLLGALRDEYLAQNRGFEVSCTEEGWRYYSAAACSEIVASYVREGRSSRLTQAALETLAVVAYRQPISRARIGAIRGVNVDGVMRTLVSRGLVTEMETDPSTGAVLYGTTAFFLERMGIASISELPPIADHLPDLSVLDDVIETGR